MPQHEPEKETYDRGTFESIHTSATAYAEEAIRLYESGYTYDQSVDLVDRFRDATSSFVMYADSFAKEGIQFPADLLAAREFLVPMRFLNLLAAGGTIEDDDYCEIAESNTWLEQLNAALDSKGFPIPLSEHSLAVATSELQSSEYFARLTDEQRAAYFDVFKEVRTILMGYSYQNYETMKQEQAEG